VTVPLVVPFMVTLTFGNGNLSFALVTVPLIDC